MPLAPGKSITLSVPLADLMVDQPIAKANYRIAIHHNYPWRLSDEPVGQ
ncbi:MAG: hypothetical protein IPK97_18180, partial [Ahniella sp.]|nr:hypothetical protein [Ahniella sp.]